MSDLAQLHSGANTGVLVLSARCRSSLLHSKSSNTQPRNSRPQNPWSQNHQGRDLDVAGSARPREMTRALRSGRLTLACRTVSSPFSPPGRRTSTTARSTASASIICSAAAPSLAALKIASTSLWGRRIRTVGPLWRRGRCLWRNGKCRRGRKPVSKASSNLGGTGSSNRSSNHRNRKRISLFRIPAQ